MALAGHGEFADKAFVEGEALEELAAVGVDDG